MTSRTRLRPSALRGDHLRFGLWLAAAIAATAQPAAAQNAPLLVTPTGRVSIGGSGAEPRAPLDVAPTARTDLANHPASVGSLYVTGTLPEGRPEGNAAPSIEFRHSNGMQGIGFGYNTIYATGSTTNQDLKLQPRGTGAVAAQGPLKVQGPLTVTGPITGPGAVPVGAIMMWSGSPTQLPAGWALCDGSNDTPDLSGRFIVGYAPKGADYGKIGDKGGRVSFNLPNHSHYIGLGDEVAFNYDVALANRATRRMNAPQGTVGVVGSPEYDKPVDLRPPYYVLAFIIYRGT